jgi:hypothetical protein
MLLLMERTCLPVSKFQTRIVWSQHPETACTPSGAIATATVVTGQSCPFKGQILSAGAVIVQGSSNQPTRQSTRQIIPIRPRSGRRFRPIDFEPTIAAIALRMASKRGLAPRRRAKNALHCEPGPTYARKAMLQRFNFCKFFGRELSLARAL